MFCVQYNVCLSSVVSRFIRLYPPLFWCLHFDWYLFRGRPPLVLGGSNIPIYRRNENDIPGLVENQKGRFWRRSEGLSCFILLSTYQRAVVVDGRHVNPLNHSMVFLCQSEEPAMSVSAQSIVFSWLKLIKILDLPLKQEDCQMAGLIATPPVLCRTSGCSADVPQSRSRGPQAVIKRI
jgi:hypothetical protein